MNGNGSGMETLQQATCRMRKLPDSSDWHHKFASIGQIGSWGCQGKGQGQGAQQLEQLPDLETREGKSKRSSDVLLRPFLMGGPMTFMTLELWDHGGHCSFRRWKMDRGSVSQLLLLFNTIKIRDPS